VVEGHDKPTDWEMIEAHLPPEWRELADRMRLIRDYPPHMNTKIKDIGSLLRVVLHYVSGSSLRMTAALASAAGVVVLTSVALHKWIKNSDPTLPPCCKGW
jgi:predicted lysophospholipase L1 biosynthesis ABC-type transport system permease subunit